MTFSNRGNDRSRSTFYGRPSFNNDRGSDRPALHDATCAKCGAACQVPFVPNGRKEVFCSKCFGEMNGDSRDSRGSGSSNYRDSGRPRMYDNRDGGSNFAEKQMFSATCDQCGSRCEVPFRPTNGKPVLCSNCFAASKGEGRAGNGELEAINAKLDKILRLLSPVSPKEASKEMTEKILDEIQANAEVSLTPPKKRTKKVAKKEA